MWYANYRVRIAKVERAYGKVDDSAGTKHLGDTEIVG